MSSCSFEYPHPDETARFSPPPPPPRQAVHPGSVQSGIVPLALVPPQRILAVIVTVVVVLPPECQSRIVELVQGGGRRRRRPRVGSRGRAVVALGFSCAYIASYVHPRLNDGEEKLGNTILVNLKLWELVIVFNKTFWSATNLCLRYASAKCGR